MAVLPPPHRAVHVRPGALATAAARPAAAPLTPGAAAGDTVPDAATAQPADWADTGILPASADEPPPEDPGLVKVSVPEARRLLRLASTPMTAAAHQAGHAWSRWRRRHQARARYHHYQARLRASPGMNHDRVTNRDCSTGGLCSAWRRRAAINIAGNTTIYRRLRMSMIKRHSGPVYDRGNRAGAKASVGPADLA